MNNTLWCLNNCLHLVRHTWHLDYIINTTQLWNHTHEITALLSRHHAPMHSSGKCHHWTLTAHSLEHEQAHPHAYDVLHSPSTIYTFYNYYAILHLFLLLALAASKTTSKAKKNGLSCILYTLHCHWYNITFLLHLHSINTRCCSQWWREQVPWPGEQRKTKHAPVCNKEWAS